MPHFSAFACRQDGARAVPQHMVCTAPGTTFQPYSLTQCRQLIIVTTILQRCNFHSWQCNMEWSIHLPQGIHSSSWAVGLGLPGSTMLHSPTSMTQYQQDAFRVPLFQPGIHQLAMGIGIAVWFIKHSAVSVWIVSQMYCNCICFQNLCWW